MIREEKNLRRLLYEIPGEGEYGPETRTWESQIGQMAATGVSCSINPTGARAKTSSVALTLDKIFNKEMSCSNMLSNPASYIEYYTKSGDAVQCVVTGNSVDGITVKTDNENNYFIIPAIFTALMCNDEFAKEVVNCGLANGVQSDKALEEIKNIYSSGNSMSKSEMQTLCDAFYFGFACIPAVAEVDASSLSATVTRLQNGNQLLSYVSDLAAPKMLTVSGNAQTTNNNRAKQTERTKPLLEWWEEDVKGGKYLFPVEWNDTQKKYINDLGFLDTVIPTECIRKGLLAIYHRLMKVKKRVEKKESFEKIIGKTPINIKFVGKPGTGKSIAIQAILTALGFPCGLINCKGRMEEDGIEGMYKYVNGKVYSVPTKAGELHGFGGAIILEEANLPDPDILQGALSQALEYPYVLNVDGYKPYKRHPFTVYIATMNIGTDGTKRMNQAFSSRFSMTIKLEDIPEDEYISVLSSTGYKKRDCKKVFRAYQAILDYLRTYHEELVLSVTMRHCLCALELIDIGEEFEDAIEDTFINEIYTRDMDVAEDVRSVIMKAI